METVCRMAAGKENNRKREISYILRVGDFLLLRTVDCRRFA